MSLFVSQIIAWCSRSRKQFDLEEDSFAFTSISFVVLEGRLSAYLHFLGMGVIPFFSRLCYIKHDVFSLQTAVVSFFSFLV